MLNSSRSHLIAVFLLAIQTKAWGADTIVQIDALSFGELVPKAGFCELDVADGSISSPDNMCLGSAELAHYRITSDPNINIIIRLNMVDDIDQGLRFAPKARLTNDLGTVTLAPIAGADTWMMTGTDGVIDIFVGGTLTIFNSLAGLQAYNMTFDLEFRRP